MVIFTVEIVYNTMILMMGQKTENGRGNVGIIAVCYNEADDCDCWRHEITLLNDLQCTHINIYTYISYIYLNGFMYIFPFYFADDIILLPLSSPGFIASPAD